MEINDKKLYILICKVANSCLGASKYEKHDLVQYGYECVLKYPKLLNSSTSDGIGYLFNSIKYFILNRIRSFRKDALFRSNAIGLSAAINKNAEYNYEIINKFRLLKKFAGKVPDWFLDERRQDDIAKDYKISQQRISKVRKEKSKEAKEKYRQWEKLWR